MNGSSPWSRPDTVAGFAQSAPNPRLLDFADAALLQRGAGRVLDIGCGAARNAIPLAARRWHVTGTDLSMPMLLAAAKRAADDGVGDRVRLIEARMDALPVSDRSFDLIVAHGIWNLARSSGEFRSGVKEAARAAAAGAVLFVFTFSRRTIPDDAEPMPGETFVFTQFSGQPQCFLTEEQLLEELGRAGFTLMAEWPLRELNRRPSGALVGGGPPVIYEGGFRYSPTE
jgi:ubiquinone/menaquinone biosynthesis C-methylase UbiE